MENKIDYYKDGFIVEIENAKAIVEEHEDGSYFIEFFKLCETKEEAKTKSVLHKSKGLNKYSAIAISDEMLSLLSFGFLKYKEQKNCKNETN